MARSRIRNKKELKLLRSELRKGMPAPELILWQKIRGKALGLKFRRQFSIDSYIIDFYSPSARLAIELDGESHFEDPEPRAFDKVRDLELAKHGIRVLRFTNRDIMENLDGVLIRIQESLPPLYLPLLASEQGEKD